MYVLPLSLVFIAMVSSTRAAGRLRPAKSYVAHKLILYTSYRMWPGTAPKILLKEWKSF